MAKTKTKKEEVVDLKPEKITKEELNEVQAIVNNINRAQLEIGTFESKKHNILHHITQQQERLGKLQVSFRDSYGTDNINIQDGTINYNKDEQVN